MKPTLGDYRFVFRTFIALLVFCVRAAYAANPQPISELLRRAVQEKHIPGAVIVIQQHGKKVYEEAAGYADLENRRPMKVDDVFRMASSSKPFAATTIMTLVDSGKLSLDDRISKYFPDFKGASTIRQALSHTSGMIGNGSAPEQLEPIRNFDRSLKNAVDLLIRQPLAYAPGEKYWYGGPSFCVVGRIAEMLTGMDFDAYMSKALVKPLALKDTVYRTDRVDLLKRMVVRYKTTDGEFKRMNVVTEPQGPRAGGFIMVPGGIYSTAADAIALLQMHLNGGTYHGKRILSEASVAEMRKKQTGVLKNEYGLGWHRSRVALDGNALEISHGGAYGTELFVDTERGLVGAIMTQMPSAEAKPFITEMKKAIRDAYDCYHSQE